MIKSYKDFEVYQEGYNLAIEMHKLTNKILKRETYEMTSQIKRASMSIPLNIAEGYGKRESKAEFKRFLRMSIGSANEMEVLIDMLKDLNYIQIETYKAYKERYEILGKRLNTLLNKWR